MRRSFRIIGRNRIVIVIEFIGCGGFIGGFVIGGIQRK